MGTNKDLQEARPMGPGSRSDRRASDQGRKEIWTLSGPGKRTKFEYSGSVETGVSLHFRSGDKAISPAFFQAILDTFRGQVVAGGFSMTSPTPRGLGEWVRDHSRRINLLSLSPRYASFIAAVLVHEGYITASLKGNAVYLQF